jgi:hypothetical protein
VRALTAAACVAHAHVRVPARASVRACVIDAWRDPQNLEAKMASLKQAHAIEIKEVRLQARFANKAAAPRAPQPPPPPPPEDDGEEEDDENEEDEVARAADDDDGDAGDAEQLELLDQLALGRPSSLSATKRPRAEQQAAAADESESETERPAKRRAAVDALHALTPQGVQDLDESDDAELDNSKDADYQREEADEEAAAEDNESSEDVLKKSRRARSAFVKALPRKAGGTSRSPQKEDGTLPLRVPFSIREKQAIIKGAIKHNIFANQKADWKSILTDKTLDFHPKRDTVAIKDCVRALRAAVPRDQLRTRWRSCAPCQPRAPDFTAASTAPARAPSPLSPTPSSLLRSTATSSRRTTRTTEPCSCKTQKRAPFSAQTQRPRPPRTTSPSRLHTSSVPLGPAAACACVALVKPFGTWRLSTCSITITNSEEPLLTSIS